MSMMLTRFRVRLEPSHHLSLFNGIRNSLNLRITYVLQNYEHVICMWCQRIVILNLYYICARGPNLINLLSVIKLNTLLLFLAVISCTRVSGLFCLMPTGVWLFALPWFELTIYIWWRWLILLICFSFENAKCWWWDGFISIRKLHFLKLVFYYFLFYFFNFSRF